MSTANKVSFGLCNVYYALCTIDATAGTPTWGKPVAIPDAQSFSFSRDTSEQKIYGDNKLIYVVKGYTGGTITLKLSHLEDDIKQALLGDLADSKSHNVEIINGTHPYFALIGQIDGDAQARRFVFLKCQATLGDESTETKSDSVTVNGDTLNISVYPVSDGNGHDAIRYTVDSEDSDYASVITAAPTLPTYA